MFKCLAFHHHLHHYGVDLLSSICGFYKKSHFCYLQHHPEGHGLPVLYSTCSTCRLSPQWLKQGARLVLHSQFSKLCWNLSGLQDGREKKGKEECNGINSFNL